MHKSVPRTALRCCFIAATTLLAFHESLQSLVATTRAGSLIGYYWLMLLAVAFAAVAVARRQPIELPIYDRQTDIIVGGLVLILAILVQGVLLERYSLYFLLLRIDLFAMGAFVLGASIVLFGLRPVSRFAWVWALPLVMVPLAYQVTVILLGGTRLAAGAATVLIAAAATAIAVGRTRRRAATGAVIALGIGLALLAVMATVTPNAPRLTFQMGPATLSMFLVGGSLYLHARRGRPKRLLERAVRPLTTRQVWAGVALTLAVAVALSLVNLPKPGIAPNWVDGMTFGRPLTAPTGWHVSAEREYVWVRRFHGQRANLIRQQIVADTADPRWDTLGRPRTVMVDTTNTWRPISLEVFPATIPYDESSSRISNPRLVDLGHGITGALVNAVNDKLFLSYDILIWTWRNQDSAQRVMLISVDNHDADAQFPEPGGGFGATLRTMFDVLFRGNTVTSDHDPAFKDAGLLTEFGRALVDVQLQQAGQSR
jgi:hypothetical protein